MVKLLDWECLQLQSLPLIGADRINHMGCFSSWVCNLRHFGLIFHGAENPQLSLVSVLSSSEGFVCLPEHLRSPEVKNTFKDTHLTSLYLRFFTTEIRAIPDKFKDRYD